MWDASINYWAVLATGATNMIVGSLWYSPLLFGKPWMKLMGYTQEKMEEAKKKGMTASYLLAFVGALVTGYVMAHFVYYLGLALPNEALQLGFWIWLGFVAVTHLGNVLWGGKSWKLFAIDSGQSLVALLVMALILVQWQ